MSEASQHQLAVKIATSATDEERVALRAWIGKLLELRAKPLSKAAKARAALAVTLESKVIWPSVRMVGRELKRLSWDERSVPARFGMSAAALGIAVFKGKAAGIAALGTAIGVPLWVVLGAGSVFACVLYEELSRAVSGHPKTKYRVIDAEKEA